MSDYNPYGSVFKRNLARSVIQQIRAEGGGVRLTQRKHNFGPLADSVAVAVEFDGNRTVRVESIDMNDDRLAGIDEHMNLIDRVERALAEAGTATPAELAETTKVGKKTIQNRLSILRKQGRAEPDGDGRWIYRGVSLSPSSKGGEQGKGGNGGLSRKQIIEMLDLEPSDDVVFDPVADREA